MNIDILHRPTDLENLLAGRIWPAGCRLPMHDVQDPQNKIRKSRTISYFRSASTMYWTFFQSRQSHHL